MSFEIDASDFENLGTDEAEKTPLKLLEGIINEELASAVSERGALNPFTVEYEGYKATFDRTKIELVDERSGNRTIDISGDGNEENVYDTFAKKVKDEVRSQTEGVEAGV